MTQLVPVKTEKVPSIHYDRFRERERKSEVLKNKAMIPVRTHTKEVYCTRTVNDKPVESGSQICSLVDTTGHNIDQCFSGIVHFESWDILAN